DLIEAAECGARRSAVHFRIEPRVLRPCVEVASREREVDALRTHARREMTRRGIGEGQFAELYESRVLDVAGGGAHAARESRRLIRQRCGRVVDLPAVLRRVAAEVARGIVLLEAATVVEERRDSVIPIERDGPGERS